MRVHEIHVKNFRLLNDVVIRLDEISTVVVGRNNSGKTSLAELLRRVFAEQSPRFQLEDFSLQAHEGFWKAWKLAEAGGPDEEVRKLLPKIEVTLTVTYDTNAPIGPLSEFVIDLNEECNAASILIGYELGEAKVTSFFAGIAPGDKTIDGAARAAFFKAIQERLPKHYKPTLSAQDPNDPSNVKPIDWKRLASLVKCEFISAQRGLDDITHKGNDVLAGVLNSLYETALRVSADPNDQDTAKKLEIAIRQIEDGVGSEVCKHLTSLLPTFSLFGYPSFPDPGLLTETKFDVERLLTDHTRIRYPGTNGVHLPESYNGLGPRNLIFILIKLHAFFKAYQASQPCPVVHLVFIEEPEAHLHPQMQEVFIQKLGEIANALPRAYEESTTWPVQFVVTTHSSHVANRAPFKAVRYFLTTRVAGGGGFQATKVKDLGTGLAGDLKANEQFLAQYMTLTRCDLLFADKAILIEGTSERLLLPRMIEAFDKGKRPEQMLSTQYITIMEVGGAYAHLFFGLLSFLELKTLVVTDLDATKDNGSGSFVACPVSDGTRTSNASINAWFPDPPNISPALLLAKTDADKTVAGRRLAFQVPEVEGRVCGRSLEQAFILANPKLFSGEPAATEEDSYDLATRQKKSEFALRHAIQLTEWTTPRYIRDGLAWLADAPADQLQPASASPETDHVVETKSIRPGPRIKRKLAPPPV